MNSFKLVGKIHLPRLTKPEHVVAVAPVPSPKKPIQAQLQQQLVRLDRSYTRMETVYTAVSVRAPVILEPVTELHYSDLGKLIQKGREVQLADRGVKDLERVRIAQQSISSLKKSLK
jgi:hypothetical protein